MEHSVSCVCDLCENKRQVARRNWHQSVKARNRTKKSLTHDRGYGSDDDFVQSVPLVFFAEIVQQFVDVFAEDV